MTERRQAIKLGAFLVGVIVLLVLSLTLVGGLRIWRDVDIYQVVTNKTVAGVEIESRVTLRGVEVGKVTRIELDESDFERVRVELSIEPEVIIPAGSKAYFRQTGLTGQRAVDITGGTLADGTLPPGSTIPRGETVLEDLEEQADVLADELATLIDEANLVVAQVLRVANAVDPDQVAAIVEETHGAVRSLTSTSERMASTIEDGRRTLRRIGEEAEAVTHRTTTVLDHADDAAVALTTLLERTDHVVRSNQEDLRATMDNLRRTSRDAEVLIRALRRQPSLLVRSQPPEERELP